MSWMDKYQKRYEKKQKKQETTSSKIKSRLINYNNRNFENLDNYWYIKINDKFVVYKKLNSRLILSLDSVKDPTLAKYGSREGAEFAFSKSKLKNSLSELDVVHFIENKELEKTVTDD